MSSTGNHHHLLLFLVSKHLSINKTISQFTLVMNTYSESVICKHCIPESLRGFAEIYYEGQHSKACSYDARRPF
ncbi:hypothetical protein EYF80_029267 [Liparis tanakae]|uniref:Uncharacterized protein n=1 Tax=Liparis tanakae TaxID=230148 RepID=A0A4Z2H6V1_9TELE|nr:hypothetical protein EYF80_029267 [Liparis tanakae]